MARRFALGPNINAPLTDMDAARDAYRASREALARADGASPVERALIEAVAVRYAEDPESVRRADLDAAFAEAMKAVHARFPDDPDVAALFADARMNQRPWDYWATDGSPNPGTAEAVAVLRDTVRRHPAHPGGHHFFVHVMEASPTPHEAVPSADALAGMVPGSGHLQHMPCHIYHRVGRYLDAEMSNVVGIAEDRAYFHVAGVQGVYEFYLAHNHHFRAWSAMFGGRKEQALDAARGLIADIPDTLKVEAADSVDGFLPLELHVMVRFGMWDDVLKADEFDPMYPIARSMRRYARGVAAAASGDASGARRELAAFHRESARVPADAVIGINAAAPVLVIARTVLEGEILYREGEYDAAFSLLGSAAEAEDKLRYDEPRPWMTPVRHAIGALALEQKRYTLAEEVYRADLERNPENGWALHGLAECLMAMDRPDEAAATRARFEAAWRHADTDLTNGSCYCRQAICCADDR